MKFVENIESEIKLMLYFFVFQGNGMQLLLLTYPMLSQMKEIGQVKNVVFLNLMKMHWILFTDVGFFSGFRNATYMPQLIHDENVEWKFNLIVVTFWHEIYILFISGWFNLSST